MTNKSFDDDVQAELIEEISEQSPYVDEAGAGAQGLSDSLGNKGSYCTITDECMPTC